MGIPVNIVLQLDCEDAQEYEVVHLEVGKLPVSSVEVVSAPGMPNWAEGDRYQLQVTFDYTHSENEPVLAGFLDQLEQVALSLESVVPETVRATLSAPPTNALVTGEYVDFLEAKVDHLMMRTYGLQMQADDTAQDLLEGLHACKLATERCEGMYTALEQQGAAYFSGMFQHLARAIEEITGNNPLQGYEVPFTRH